jgi:predicted RNase H-like nuclease (RuvC/YqgF family)
LDDYHDKYTLYFHGGKCYNKKEFTDYVNGLEKENKQLREKIENFSIDGDINNLTYENHNLEAQICDLKRSRDDHKRNAKTWKYKMEEFQREKNKTKSTYQKELNKKDCEILALKNNQCEMIMDYKEDECFGNIEWKYLTCPKLKYSKRVW